MLCNNVIRLSRLISSTGFLKSAHYSEVEGRSLQIELPHRRRVKGKHTKRNFGVRQEELLPVNSNTF
jgi:hypothetical protein